MIALINARSASMSYVVYLCALAPFIGEIAGYGRVIGPEKKPPPWQRNLLLSQKSMGGEASCRFFVQDLISNVPFSGEDWGKSGQVRHVAFRVASAFGR